MLLGIETIQKPLDLTVLETDQTPFGLLTKASIKNTCFTLRAFILKGTPAGCHVFSLHGADAEVSCHLQPPHPWQPPMETPCKNMAAEGAGAAGRAPACLCVFCGLPAAGKSTLARKVLRTAAQCGWRAGVVPYDDLIPERAFQTGVAEGGGKLREMVKTRSILVATQKKSAIISPPSIAGGVFCLSLPRCGQQEAGQLTAHSPALTSGG